MALKTILVCLTTPDHAATLMRAAVPLARRYGAHLIGLHTIEALVVYPGIAMHIPEPAFASFNQSQRETSEAIKVVFEEHTHNENFVSEFRLVKADAKSASTRIIESARAADMVIMAHEDPKNDRYDQHNLQAQVIRKSGRPVIVVPLDYDGPEIGQNILMGWSDTREAARAAHDLLAVVQKEATVTILRIEPVKGDAFHDDNATDMAQMFARHGLKPTLETRDPMGSSIAATLNKAAFEHGSDLIVTGAFGHSRAYDVVIGATTYALLREQDIPVLFSV